MPQRWQNIDLDVRIFRNLDEEVLRRSAVTLENAFINEADGHSRFPGAKPFAQIGSGKVYLHDWRGDLMASTTAGKTFRLDEDANPEDVTGVVLTGSGRVIFAKTDDQLVMAAGGPIVQFGGKQTALLSNDAPFSTHVAYLNAFLLAIEPDSGRFFHCKAGEYRNWDPIDVFAAEYNPDPLTALITTDFSELILAGQDSMEQFEPFPGADRPFFRRWSLGQGVSAPYTLISADNGVWAINKIREFTRFAGQSSKVQSEDIGLTLQQVDSFDGAWAALMNLFGQKFILLTLPEATNPYGTRGFTLLLDIRQRRWSFLYGWDDDLKLPNQYLANSYHTLWGRHFIGGFDGQILELDRHVYSNDGMIQPMLYRTAHLDQFGLSSIENLRLRMRRGVGGYNDAHEPMIQLRVRRDNRVWGKWQAKGLGRPGDRDMWLYFGPQGNAHTWQFEYRISDAVDAQVTAMQVVTTGLE